MKTLRTYVARIPKHNKTYTLSAYNIVDARKKLLKIYDSIKKGAKHLPNHTQLMDKNDAWWL